MKLKTVLFAMAFSLTTSTAIAGKTELSISKLLPPAEVKQLLNGAPSKALESNLDKYFASKLPKKIHNGDTLLSVKMKGDIISFKILLSESTLNNYSEEVSGGLVEYMNDELYVYYCKITSKTPYLKSNPKIYTDLFETVNKKMSPAFEGVYTPKEECN
ncbi:hypothetical protein EC844_11259 [Acinetobacter calcoaceticus]|uniref:Uncharacterized protein n=1 Tax=Acinetobacter calcoaceticus TaxID=471 RepID=A0A4R1XRZ5_ACICA|nr:hypothetical protein EC844_11259 [Acinetobacter calcoaceticus]